MKEFTSKKITHGNEAQDKLLAGAKIVADIVGMTMGPGGKLACYDSPYMSWPIVTKDGVSVAREVILEDKQEKLGADLVRQAANTQLEASGDGTTLASVLSYEILAQGLKLIRSGLNPHKVRQGIKLGVKDIVQELKEMAIPIKHTAKDYARIATIACNGDKELGDLIGEAIYKAGKYGVVTHTKGDKDHHELIIEKGYHWDSGVDAYYFNDNQGMSHPETLILVTDHRLRWGKDIKSIALKVKEYSDEVGYMVPLLIVCPEISGEARSNLINANDTAGYKIVHSAPEGIASQQKQCMKDIAAFTGATYLSEELGVLPTRFDIEHLGWAGEVKATRLKTIITPKLNTNKDLDTYIKQISLSLDQTKDAGEKKMLEKSLARLTGGFAIIKAGASIDSDRVEIMDRMDDAIKATNAAKEEGIVPGGGVALLMAKQSIIDNSGIADYGNDVKSGYNLILKAVERPIRQILSNSDNEDSSFIISKLMSRVISAYSVDGENLVSGVTMNKLGIIDPVKVIRTALEISASVAGQMLQTGGIITRIDDEN